ncbi:acyltransferase family protein, partial [Candidatus Poribacteria bacterium]|nr:acyltransferase family protein [Candidatus Poribacteria bacterium]
MHNDSTPSPARRHDLDALRAFAMLLGIALHAALSFVRFPWIVQDSRQHDGFGLFFVAVHGFRMPLFFLLSGFFTAMLWRRRGLRSLLAQRVRRIVLPLGLCMVTFVPATTWVSGVALRSGMKSGATAPRKAAADVGIWRAVRQGDVGAIQGHLVDGADVDELHPQLEVTPLALAAVLGRVDVVDVLVRAGANVDARDGNGATALHGAAFFGHAGVVRRLIEGGADPNAQTDAGATAAESLATDWATTQFIAAIVGYPADRDRVLAGREEVAEALDGATGVSRPAPVDIWSAAQRGDVDAVEALLDAGTDVDGRHPESGGTPLAIAALFDQTDVVALLLRRGADVDARGGDGATALHAAAFFGRAGAAELLIEAGADLEARNGSGSTAGESLAATWELTEFIAGMIQIDVDEPEVMEGREQVAALLAERGSGGGVRPSPRSGRWVQRARRLMAAS